MAQYWDAANGVWKDDQYPDIWMKPSDAGGDNLWHNQQGLVSDGGAWMSPQQYQQNKITPQQQNTVLASMLANGQNPGTVTWQTGQPNTVMPQGQGGSGQQQGVSQALPVGNPQVSPTTGAYQNVPGYGYAVNQQQYQNTSDLNSQTQGYTQQNQAAQTQANMQLEQMREASAQNLANLQSQMQLEISKGNNANALTIAQMQNAISQEQNRLQGLQVQINQAAEMRQERTTQAQLAANPNDFVAYEYYKRALGNPSTIGAVSGQANNQPVGGASGSGQTLAGGWSNGGQEGSVSPDGKWVIQNSTVVPNPGGTDSVATPLSATSPGQMLNGQAYSPAPPAYSDNTLANVANNIQNPNTQQWNPNLSGQGAFGSTINAPNQLGRADYGSLSDSEKGILTSFLNAGVNMGGQQVSIDPTDYFKQMQQSWVPTLSDVTSGTQYRE